MTYHSGFAAIIGCPNVGKSTLLNRLVGQKIAIVTDRAQTTRNKITGVLTREDYQIVFLDTPGLTTPKNRLGSFMQQVATQATRDVDAILFVLDTTAHTFARDRAILENLTVGAVVHPTNPLDSSGPASARPPIFILLNKSDAASAAQLENAENLVHEINPNWPILKISALTGKGVPELEAALRALLPPGPQYFPPDMVTDQPERLICAEIVREKALQLLREEVPHGVGVGIDKMALRVTAGTVTAGTVRSDTAVSGEPSPCHACHAPCHAPCHASDLMDIWATVYIERESQKGILIGKGGSMLKRIGTEARRDIEGLLGQRVNLQLWVKVKEDWRNKPSVLAELGYTYEK